MLGLGTGKGGGEDDGRMEERRDESRLLDNRGGRGRRGEEGEEEMVREWGRGRRGGGEEGRGSKQ